MVVNFLEVKSLVNVLKIYEEPSLTSKVLGTLEENQTVPMITSQALEEITPDEYGTFYDEFESFYQVMYQAKLAYVPANSVEIIKSNEPWIGEYGNQEYSGTGVSTALYVYKKTPDYIHFVSHIGYRYDPIDTLFGARNALEI